jgi:putative heme transporter
MGDSESQPPRLPPTPSANRRQYLKSAGLLAVTAVSLYLLLPSLLSVFSSWRTLLHLDWRFGVLVFLFEAVSSVCLWEVDRIALGSKAWFPIACSQLAGNALGRIVPASATPFTVVLLRKAGVDGGEAAAALTVSTGLQISTALALPVLAIPAMIGGAPVSRGLATAAYLGAAVVVLLIGAGAVLFTTDAPLKWLGRSVQWVLNATVRRRRHVTGLSDELLSDRDFIRATIHPRWKSAVLAAAGNTGFDYLALLCALRAVGAAPRPSLVVLAYAAAELLALIPFTPGGLGFVEAGLVGTLALAGVSGPAALAATLLYRLVSFWLPIPVGGIAYLSFRHRYT